MWAFSHPQGLVLPHSIFTPVLIFPFSLRGLLFVGPMQSVGGEGCSAEWAPPGQAALQVLAAASPGLRTSRHIHVFPGRTSCVASVRGFGRGSAVSGSVNRCAFPWLPGRPHPSTCPLPSCCSVGVGGGGRLFGASSCPASLHVCATLPRSRGGLAFRQSLASSQFSPFRVTSKPLGGVGMQIVSGQRLGFAVMSARL